MKRFLTWITRISTLQSVILIVIIFMAFILYVLPMESAKSAALGMNESIDTALFYTRADLYRIAESYGEAGRSFYITQRFTFDLVWPFVYAFFLLITTTYLTLKVKWDRSLKAFVSLILIGVGLDFSENICASIVLSRYPETTPFLADISGFATALKWLSLGIAFIVLIGLLGFFLLGLIKKTILRKGIR